MFLMPVFLDLYFPVFVILGRKPAARLDISGTPGVEQLRPMEREVIQ